MRGASRTAWLDRARSWMSAEVDLLACVYTCEQHRFLLERFYASEVGTFLRGRPATRIVEVYAAGETSRPRLTGSVMEVPAMERYEDLALKTYRMIEFAVRRVRFRRLLKIDVTNVLTELDSPEYADRKPVDIAALTVFLRNADPRRDYDGFLQHARAGRDGAMNWARKKGLVLDYERLFGDGLMPPYYSGKCYLLSRRFAAFIARTGADLANEHQRHFPAAEDVMVARNFERFRAHVHE